jgi:NIMA (never in mitosis gene a)-related kinase
LASTGVVSTCGRADDGMLGHAGQIPLLSPQGIQSLIGTHVQRIAVGHKHMAAITDMNELYTWGSNAYRQLGAPDIEIRSPVPVQIVLPSSMEIADVYCGADATAVVTKDSRLLVCGSNAHNKLGLNPRFGLLSRRQVDKAERLTAVKINNKGLVEDVSLGQYCTSLVMNTGKVYVLGSNQYGSLGTGRLRSA